MRELKSCLAAAAALFTALVLAPAADAHPSPEGCTGSTPMVRFHTDTISQTAATVRQGDTITLGARFANTGTGACDLSDISIRVRIPNPDGTPGDYRNLTGNLFLAAGVTAEGFTEATSYTVDLNEGVFSAPLEISWQATEHSGEKDSVINGEGTALQVRVTRPRASLTVSPDFDSGIPPLAVNFTYSLSNDSPASSAGTPGPSLVPGGVAGSRDVLSVLDCSPVTYLSGDSPSDARPTLDPGETWKFTCMRTFLLPGVYNSQPTITATSSADGRPWPQPLSDPAPVTVLGSDLTIDKSHTGDLLAGGKGEYRLKVSNGGNLAATGPVTVADQLPAGLTATEISGEGWDCELASVSCSRSDSLAPGGSYPDVILGVAVDPNPANSVVNTATVSGGGEPYGALANNTDSDPTSIRTPTQPDPSAGRVFKVRKIKSRPDGTAVLKVNVPAAGLLTVDDARRPDLVRRSTRKTGKAKKVSIVVRAKRRLRRKMVRTGKPRRVKLRVSFTARDNPQSVSPVSTVRTVTFSIG